MDSRYINCIAHNMSEGNLLLGDDGAALFDCGMLFCADRTIEKVKAALFGRPLSYIFATHTHYDHIGALPFFREEWPEVKVVTSEHGCAVLQKETPRRVIRELSIEAAELYRPDQRENCLNYSDGAFYADITVKENDEISLGGLTVRVIETPGHTRDSLSFFIPELKLLILSETTGGVLGDDVYSSYLTSYNSAMESIEKCGAIPFEFISMAHSGIIPQSDAENFFSKTGAATRECRDFILSLRDAGMSEEAMVDAFTDRYLHGAILNIQPEVPFQINARATIACTLRDF